MDELDIIQGLNDQYFQPASNVKAVEHNSFNTSLIDYLREFQTKYDALEQKFNKIYPKNVGWFSPLELGGQPVGTSFTRSGDVVSAVLQSTDEGSNIVRVTLSNPMPSLNYKIRIDPESLGIPRYDDDTSSYIFKKISTTQFDFSVSELYVGVIQSIKIHIEAISLD